MNLFTFSDIQYFLLTMLEYKLKIQTYAVILSFSVWRAEISEGVKSAREWATTSIG